MREIKFRGKSLNNGEWFYGSLLSWKNGCTDMLIEDDICEMLDEIPVDTETVGQFTGLRDKNGREIYEGDIVRFYNDVEDELIPAEVIYKADTCSFRLKPKDLDPVFLFAYWHYEVVGNIHDNPELINK